MIVRQVATISQSSLFLKYAPTLYNHVSKQLKEAKNYCDVVPKLKKKIYFTKQHVLYPIWKKFSGDGVINLKTHH